VEVFVDGAVKRETRSQSKTTAAGRFQHGVKALVIKRLEPETQIAAESNRPKPFVELVEFLLRFARLRLVLRDRGTLIRCDYNLRRRGLGLSSLRGTAGQQSDRSLLIVDHLAHLLDPKVLRPDRVFECSKPVDRLGAGGAIRSDLSALVIFVRSVALWRVRRAGSLIGSRLFSGCCLRREQALCPNRCDGYVK